MTRRGRGGVSGNSRVGFVVRGSLSALGGTLAQGGRERLGREFCDIARFDKITCTGKALFTVTGTRALAQLQTQIPIQPIAGDAGCF